MGEKMREKCLSAVEHEKTLIDNIFAYVHIEGQKDKKLKKILDLLNGWY